MRLGLDGSPLLEIKTGVGRYTYELATALSRLSLDLEMFYYYGTSWSRQISSTDSGDVLSTWRRVAPLGLRKLFPVVIKDFLKPRIFKYGYQRNKLDLYHATNYVAPAVDMPLVVTIYDLSFLRYPETHPADRLAWLNKGFPVTIQNAVQIITISEFSKNEIIELLGVSQKKITIAHPGVDSRLRPLDPEQLAPLLKSRSLKPGGTS